MLDISGIVANALQVTTKTVNIERPVLLQEQRYTTSATDVLDSVFTPTSHLLRGLWGFITINSPLVEGGRISPPEKVSVITLVGDSVMIDSNTILYIYKEWNSSVEWRFSGLINKDPMGDFIIPSDATANNVYLVEDSTDILYLTSMSDYILYTASRVPFAKHSQGYGITKLLLGDINEPDNN